MVVEWSVVEAAERSGIEKYKKNKGKNSDIIATMVVQNVLTPLLWYGNILVSCMIQGVFQGTFEKSITQIDIEVPLARKVSHLAHIPALIRPNLQLLFLVVGVPWSGSVMLRFGSLEFECTTNTTQ